MKALLLTITFVFIFTLLAFGQTTEQILGQISQAYSGGEETGKGLIGGFSIGGLIGGCFFGSIGFIAFMYGKSNSEFRPIVMGILLMAYPYFLRGTVVLYLVGIALTAGLYFWRE